MSDKKLVVGILAHVDAGKTTLAESMLYTGGSIRRMGRVDHGDAFLDTDRQERDRGITIFSKQARIQWQDMEIVLLDTPGHVDFAAETERTLPVLDYAVLVISGADGVQGHVLTLWKLLARYRVPVFLFINKMDQPGTDADALLKELKEKLSVRCVPFGNRDAAFYEEIAVCDEKLLERYLEIVADDAVTNDAAAGSTAAGGTAGDEESKKGAAGRAETVIDRDTIASLVAQRRVFPCYFGSALKAEGVEELLDGLYEYSRMPSYTQDFGARVYKIARDAQGTRLTYVKITGGTLKVKQTIRTYDRGTKEQKGAAEGRNGGAESAAEEKVDQIRIYSGEKYTTKQEVCAGTICALTGPAATYCGQGLGAEEGRSTPPLLEPVMTYRVALPEGCDIHRAYKELCQLEEEEPQLHIVWNEQAGEIQAQLMGEVQLEILRNIMKERFGTKIDFDEGSIVYKETIASTVEGVGHYEPLRHYAEVHLLLEPGEPGSGVVCASRCSEDELDRNWQRLVLTHLEEKKHVGVLTGSPVTDIRITLVAGRAHIKHTEGGDFRQATYRAVRQGLCKAQSVLLEPVYAFSLELPAALIGRGMTDIQARSGRFDAPDTAGETAVLRGTVPASEIAGYQAQVLAYSGGKGRFHIAFKGYEPCHNAAQVIGEIGYEAGRDMQNPCGSVFCAHGAGFNVDWDQVEDYMHLPSVFATADGEKQGKKPAGTPSGSTAVDFISQEEIDEIMNRTYGTKERKKQGWAKTIQSASGSDGAGPENGGNGGRPSKRAAAGPQEEYLLVDGYNIIFAWDFLNELAKTSLDGARGRLMDILSNYQGYRRMRLILVFDAYKVKGNPGSTQRYHNIDVVYTKEAETADQYIEKVTHEIGRKHHVRVATSDGLEQLIIMGAGAVRVSAAEFREEVMAAGEELRQMFLDGRAGAPGDRNYLMSDASEEVTAYVERLKNEGR